MAEAFRQTMGNLERDVGIDDEVDSDLAEHDRISQLAVQAGKGDQTAFAELYSARVQKVAAYVHSITRNQADLEDVVANVFVRAWKRLPTLKNTGKFDSWLFSIAHNQAIDSIRRRNDRSLPIDDARDSATKSPDDLPDLAAIRRSESEELLSALTELSEEPRMVLVLRFLHGMSHEEVALQLGKKPEAIRAMQYRALGRLRSILEERKQDEQIA